MSPKKIPRMSFKGLFRFLSFVKIGENAHCWEWQGELTKNGYGVFYYGLSVYLAHRISFFIQTEKDPENLFVCHSCDNRKCVNPSHLFLGSAQDNMDDMYKKGRYVNASLNGSLHPKAKLNEDKVLKIKNLIESQKLSNTEIGKLFSVSHSTIWAIRNGRAWKHVKTKGDKNEIR